MSSTFAENIQNAIQEDDSNNIVSLLEPRVHDGTATESESLLCGILLMMPPFADYEAAPLIFNNLLKGTRRFEAAVWSAYHYTVLMPDGDTRFEDILKSFPHSSIAAHFLSKLYEIRNEKNNSLLENRKSLSIRPFPFNIIRALRIDFDLSTKDKNKLFKTASDLILDKNACGNKNISTIDGLIQLEWDNLIVGTRITHVLWNSYIDEFKEYVY